MSLATRCNHCGTIFKVVQDQLKVSEGWVRCGRCHEVFNALPALFDLEKDPPPPRPAHLAGQAAATAPGGQIGPGSTQQAGASGPQAASSAGAEDAEAASSQGEPSSFPDTTTSDFPATTSPEEDAEWSQQTFPPPSSGLAQAAARMPIPLASMPDVRPSPAASTVATPESASEGTMSIAGNPAVAEGIVGEADVELGFDTHPPSDWARTQPASEANDRDLDEGALALDPTPIEATTDFELDTAIAVDDNTPLEAVLASVAPRQHAPAPAGAPAPGAGRPSQADTLPRTEPPQRAWLDAVPDNLPSTEEEDALDSRYLMPSPTRDRKPQRRLEEGPEFADAQFPSDAFIDAEEDWASDFGPSALDGDAATPPSSPTGAGKPGAPIGGLRITPKGAGENAGQADASVDNDGLPEDEPPSDPDATLEEAEAEAAPKTRKRRRKKSTADGSAEAEPEFMRRAQRQAFWRHPATRATLLLLLVALIAGLGLQTAHQFRDLIAAHHPPARPLLAQWCQAVGCQIKPPLHIEDLQVESATLVRAASEGPDSYRLAVVVHNRAPIDLAWPHVDLTLTDENGAVIARRVFAPQDAQWLDTADPKAEAPANGSAGASAASTPPAVPGRRSTTLQWRILAPDIQPAGYTAELFYP